MARFAGFIQFVRFCEAMDVLVVGIQVGKFEGWVDRSTIIVLSPIDVMDQYLKSNSREIQSCKIKLGIFMGTLLWLFLLLEISGSLLRLRLNYKALSLQKLDDSRQQIKILNF